MVRLTWRIKFLGFTYLMVVGVYALLLIKKHHVTSHYIWSRDKGHRKINSDLIDLDNCDTGPLGVPSSLSKSQCPNCNAFTCEQLLFSSVKDPIYGELLSMTGFRNFTLPQINFEQITNDCDYYKEARGYHLKPANKEEENFPIAYNILMHTDAAQVEQILRAIYRPQNVYCIHIDAKSPQALHQEMRAIVKCFPNVFIASKLETVVYAGYSRLQADINCMKDMVAHPIRWIYLINTAAQAFPLKSNGEIVKILKIYNGSNDIEGIKGGRELWNRIHFEWNESINSTHQVMTSTTKKNRLPPHNIRIMRGSAYGVFSRSFVEFILTNPMANDLLEWSRKTWSPDEFYWATLHHTYFNSHLNTPGAFSGIPSKKRWLAVFSAWKSGDKCHGKWRHFSCVFGLRDLPLLMERRELFANKFERSLQPQTLECLDAWIEYKTRCPPDDATYDFYRELPFVNQ